MYLIEKYNKTRLLELVEQNIITAKAYIIVKDEKGKMKSKSGFKRALKLFRIFGFHGAFSIYNNKE